VNIWAAAAIAFSLGLPSAWAWGAWAIAVQERKAVAAAAWDIVICAGGTVGPLLLWAAAAQDWRVLVSGALGNVLGTYFVVKLRE